jgi:hypothetical protein
MVEVTMPLYARVKDHNGVARFVPVNPEIRQLPEPVAATSFAEPARPRPTYTCTLCRKTFGSAGVASLHVTRVHHEMMTDAETWKSYVQRDTHDDPGTRG